MYIDFEVDGTTVTVEDIIDNLSKPKLKQLVQELESHIDGDNLYDYYKMKLVRELCDNMDIEDIQKLIKQNK